MTASLRLSVAGGTMFRPPAPFFLRTWGTCRFPTFLHTHRPRSDR
jgi:hypothetical protein